MSFEGQPPQSKSESQYIEDSTKRHASLSKRRMGLFKKAHELSILTGTQVLLVVADENKQFDCFASDLLQPLSKSRHLHAMLQSCLEHPRDNYSSTNQPGMQTSIHPVAFPQFPMLPPHVNELDSRRTSSDTNLFTHPLSMPLHRSYSDTSYTDTTAPRFPPPNH
ncbi:hypothetical protein GEMRC1_003916 [Eukaryota sp. GEM-RC1]